ncbi:MAG: hypothetical protein IJ672_09705 [Methanobrevibacter sp.]|nr:hypothetical protein [Methanobrevibacter sp.]
MIRLLILTLLGFENMNKPKYDLRRQLTVMDKVNIWFNMHKYELLLLIVIAVMIMTVIALVWWFPAMDPYTNRFSEVI